MATPVIMPRQGNTVESCIISEWHKKEGDTVKTGDVLFTYETDKASFDEESQVDGTLLKIFYGVDDEVLVLTNVCVIGDPFEDISEFDPAGGAEESNIPEIEKEPVIIQPEKIEKISDGDLKISPRARNLADKERVDPRDAAPSGPHNRIIEKDIIELAATGQKATFASKAGFQTKKSSFVGTGIGSSVTSKDMEIKPQEKTPLSSDFEDVKLPNIRKVIAKAMHASLSTTAQLTLNSSFDASAMQEFRKQMKMTSIEVNITINDIILFAVAKVIKNHKDMNAHFLDDKIRYFKNVHMGIAVDTNRGLLVPTLFYTDLMSLSELAVKSKALVSKAQSGTISPDELTGGTFTVTNLGTLGIESFTPVINPPQTGILGVNNITYKQKKTDEGFLTYPALGLSLTFDHRALDGAPAAKFLKDLTNALENMYILLV